MKQPPIYTFTPGTASRLLDNEISTRETLPAITLPDGSQILLSHHDPACRPGQHKRRKEQRPVLDERNRLGQLMVDALNAARPTDAQIRTAVEADMQQWATDLLTPTRGYVTPIDNVKALLTGSAKGAA